MQQGEKKDKDTRMSNQQNNNAINNNRSNNIQEAHRILDDDNDNDDVVVIMDDDDDDEVVEIGNNNNVQQPNQRVILFGTILWDLFIFICWFVFDCIGFLVSLRVFIVDYYSHHHHHRVVHHQNNGDEQQQQQPRLLRNAVDVVVVDNNDDEDEEEAVSSIVGLHKQDDTNNIGTTTGTEGGTFGGTSSSSSAHDGNLVVETTDSTINETSPVRKNDSNDDHDQDIRVFKLLWYGYKGDKDVFLERHREQQKYVVTTNSNGYKVFSLKFYTNNHGPIQFDMWDREEHKHIGPLLPDYYIQGQCAIMMFDDTDSFTWKYFCVWHPELTRLCSNIRIVVVCKNENAGLPRGVPYATRKNIPEYYFSSQSTKEEIEEPFLDLARKLLDDDTVYFVNNVATTAA